LAPILLPVQLSTASSSPAISILLPGMPSISTLTVSVGPGADGYVGIGVRASAGFYGCLKPKELGWFYSYGGGWWLNIGASIGVTLAFIFGPPSDMDGVSYAAGVDVGKSPGTGWSGNAMLLFTPPPFRILGIAIGAAWGWSASVID